MPGSSRFRLLIFSSFRTGSKRIAAYFTFYNSGRPHSALDCRTPDVVYFEVQPQREAA